MLRRVNPVVLISLITVLILSIAIFAVANTGGGRDAALGAATGQVGMPYGFGTDGPGSFSCTGLVRHALRSAGVDPNAPWDHMAYLGAYPTVSDPQPGDVVVYPDGAAMYVGNGQVVMANHADGVVGLYGMNEIGTPVGFANPYGDGGAVDPAMSDPAAVQPAGGQALDPALAPLDPALAPMDEGLAPMDEGLAPMDEGLAPMDEGLAPIDPALAPLDPALAAAPVDQGLVPAAVDQYLP
jgi:NlpC/P60 family